MPGNQSRTLIEISKAKGWDPTEMIAGSDLDPGGYPGNQGAPGVGRIAAAPDPTADHPVIKPPSLIDTPSNEGGARSTNAPIPVLSKLLGI